MRAKGESEGEGRKRAARAVARFEGFFFSLVILNHVKIYCFD